MKKLLFLLLLAPVLGFGQGEQRYADGTATDQEGNTFEWINYGDLDFSIENAEVVTYRDGTPIPQVTGSNEWQNLTTGAWCYYDNDPTKGKLYNWYAVAGIHDAASLTDTRLRKSFAPEGWRVTSDNEWTRLENYLIDNGYNYDGTTTENYIAKAMASKTGWNISLTTGSPGQNQSLNNRSGFNSFPEGYRHRQGHFLGEADTAHFHTPNGSPTIGFVDARALYSNTSTFMKQTDYQQTGRSVRFVRNASTASTKDYSDAITIYPNPTSSIINIEQDFTNAKVYDISGKELLKTTSKTIDLSELPSNIYLLRLYDNNNRVLGTGKIVKN